MNKKKKVMVVLMNRANYARSKSILRSIQSHPDLELCIVAGSGMLLERFGKAVKVVREDGFTIDDELYMSIEGENPQTMAQSVGVGIQLIAPIMKRLSPDIVVTIADRYETLATALAASYMNITLAHTQGGELTGTIDESVRHAITKLSHLHFASTEESRRRIIQMGENPEFVYNTGCPSIDLAEEADKSLEKLASIRITGTGEIDLSKPYVVVMQHPVTTEFGAGYDQMTETLHALKLINMPALVLWPNPDAGSDDISKAIRIFRERESLGFPVKYFKNFEPEDYITVISNAKCLIGNSSSFIREGAYLGTPAVIVGTRQSGREHGGNIVNVPYARVKIAEAAIRQINNGRYKSDPIFGGGNAGQKIANILATAEPPIQKKFFDLA